MMPDPCSGEPHDRRWPFYPLALLHDAARCLALAQQGQLRLSPQEQLDDASLSRLASAMMLAGGTPEPFSDVQAPGLRFLLELLARAGLVAAVADRLCPTAVAHDWLGLPAHRQIDQLRQAWWLHPGCNTCWLPPTRRQQPLDARYQAVIVATARWVAGLPTDRSTPTAALEAHLADCGLMVGRVGGNLPSVRRALEQRTVAVGRFVAEVALPRLGLVDVEPGCDGLCVQPTPGGVAWLEAALDRAHLLAHPPAGISVEWSIPTEPLRLPPAPGPALVIDPDASTEPESLSIRLCLDAPALCTFEIAHFAELLSPGPLACYRLTRQSLAQAVAWGHSVADVLFFLRRFGDGQLPASAEALLRTWGDELSVLVCEPGYRLHAAAPGILAALRQRQPFRQRTRPFASADDAWVGYSHAHDLFRYLRRTGYTLQGAEERGQRIPSFLSPFPLSSLLVVLRTYEQLRRLVPGLAILELETLEKTIAATLLPDDLAGVERLVESHLLFLRHHLSRAQGRGRLETAEQEAPDTAGDPPPGEAPPSEPPSGDLENRLKAAIAAGTPLLLTYADTQGQVSHRRVRPLHLETRWGRDYLLAYCELRQDERHFRLDRIVEVTDEAQP